MNGDDQNQGGQPQTDDIGGGSAPEPTSEPTSEPTTDVPVQAPPGEDASTPSEPAVEVPPPPPADTGETPGSDESPS